MIPHRSNTKEPTRLNKTAYRARNGIEQLIGKAKEFRRIEMRHEKLKRTFRGLIHLAVGFLRVKRTINVNRA